MNHDEMIKGLQDALSVRRVVGDPIERDGVTVIPVAAVRGGWGGGGGTSGGAVSVFARAESARTS